MRVAEIGLAKLAALLACQHDVQQTLLRVPILPTVTRQKEFAARTERCVKSARVSRNAIALRCNASRAAAFGETD